MRRNFIADGPILRLELLQQSQRKPPLFAPGESIFWDDDHISEQMLKAHLDPETDAASYRPERIDRSITWLVDTLKLGAETKVLDLGCGPGLYAARLAERHIRVTGVDFSRRSINYARQVAQEFDLDIVYRCQDYLTLEDAGQYDIVLLISGDFCPLAPRQRFRLLQVIHRALKDGGHFVLDVTTPEYRKDQRMAKTWYATAGGFWKPGPHLVLEQRFVYAEQAVRLNQFTVIEPDGRLTVYRNWVQAFTQDTITSELEQGGFSVRGIWGDLLGTPYTQDSEWMGVLAQKS